jgi:beta-glucosidase
VASSSGGDRETIELPPVQQTFLRELRRHAKKLVLVLTGGSAIAIPKEHEICDAVLHAWYPGCEGGNALADVLFGDVSPSGKLPVTVPRRTEDLPAFDDYRMRGRTYRFAEIDPLYPFGFGLSYATLIYGAASASLGILRQSETITVRATVGNLGPCDTQEIVQCYVVPPRNTLETPRASLVAFQKVALPANSIAPVEFRLGADAFHQLNVAGECVWIPGDYMIVIGSASPGGRALQLGAPPPVNVLVRLE